MNKLPISSRNIIITAAYVCLTALFFVLGCAVGYSNGKVETVSVTATAEEETAAPSAAPQSYRVILEDGELRLYSDKNGISRLISSEEISEQSFPASDTAALKEGRSFKELNAALELMENFLS